MVAPSFEIAAILGRRLMVENEFYSQLVHGPYQIFNIGDLVLEGGDTLRQCQLAYATFGTLNDLKDNAVLVTTWFAGTNKIMEQAYIGPGRALNPEKYFIIVINQIDGGLSGCSGWTLTT
jgi:homoserine O-acetyltransferase